MTVSGVFYGTLSAIKFEDTITVGSILIAALVVIAGGIFTFRNNMRTFWKSLAEERLEQIKVLEEHNHQKDIHIAELQEHSKLELAKTVEDQRTVRHELKNEIAQLTASLRVEQAKTDLSALLEQLANQHSEAMGNIVAGLQKQDEIIRLLVNGSADEPLHRRDR